MFFVGNRYLPSEEVSSTPSVSRSCIINNDYILSQALSASIEILYFYKIFIFYIIFFFFKLLIWGTTLADFCVLNQFAFLK